MGVPSSISRPRTCRELPFTAEEFDDGESDGIGTARRAGREDPVGAVVDGRSAEQFVIFGAIEDPENEQVRKAFDVGEAECEFRQDFEDAFGIVLGARAFGDLLGVVVWTLNVSDGLRRKHGGPSLDMRLKFVAALDPIC